MSSSSCNAAVPPTGRATRGRWIGEPTYGRTLWFNVAGVGGVDLVTYELRREAEVGAMDRRVLPRPWVDSPLAPTPGPQGTAVVARVDDTRKLLWRADTGIGRSALQQILPGTHATAFVGTRPPVPDKVSEPLLVIIEHDSGRQVTHSLWQ